MANLTPLSRPTHNLVNIDPNPRESMSDGLNYPSFRLLNKRTRAFLSEPQKINPVFAYRLLAIANIKGWFAAVTTEGNGSSIIFSTLLDLRSSLKSEKENDENLLVPRRTVRLSAGDVNIITFGMHDTRLIVAFTGGQLLVYDTTHLLPNPRAGTHLVAVARADGIVQILDMNTLEAKYGWSGEGDSAPVAISWAPKGKHLAIGLRVGDIVTYALSNNTLPHKQIPPTVDGYLVSLDWVASPLVFKTTYCSKIPESSDATLHIVHADAKSSTGFYYNLMHPFPAADRNKMHALMLSFPKWDEDSGSTPENASGLAIIGDMSSVDLEVLAHKSAQWFQQSQKNPLQLPLDKNMNDTIITSLEADLTDLEANVPIMYAYLNDGTLQGWTLDHPKPYVGMIKSDSAIAFHDPVIAQGTPTFAAALSPPASSTPFGPEGGPGQPATSSFSQQPKESPFSEKATFRQTSFGSGQAFGQSSNPVCSDVQKLTAGVSRSLPTKSGFSNFAFSQPSLDLGTLPSADRSSAPQPATRNASMSDETSFGNLNLGDDQTTPQPKSGGSSFTPPAANTTPTSTFSSSVKPAVGFRAFNNSQAQQNFSSDAPKSAFGAGGSVSSTTQPGQPTFGQSGFGKPSFGQSSFGQSSFVQASLGKQVPTPSGSGGFNSLDSRDPITFSTPSKPTTTGGFSAYASSSLRAFGTITKPTSAEHPKTSPFGVPSGVSGGDFGTKQTLRPSTTSDSPPSSPVIVRPSGSVDNDMSPPRSPVKREATTPTALFRKQQASATLTNPPVATAPKFGVPSMPNIKSAFTVTASKTPTKSPPSGGFGAFSGTYAGFASFAGSKKSFTELLKEAEDKPVKREAKMPSTTVHPPPANAFSNLATPIKPASGFGVLSGASANSPFFNKTESNPTKPIVLFGKQPVSTTPVTTEPKFGVTSMPNTKSAAATVAFTTATKSPPIGGFGAFSGTSTGFASFAESEKSFTELKTAEAGVAPSTGSSGTQPTRLVSTPLTPIPSEKTTETGVAPSTRQVSTPLMPVPSERTAETGVTPSTAFFGTQPTGSVSIPLSPFPSEANCPASVSPNLFGKPSAETGPASPSTSNVKEPSNDAPGFFAKPTTPAGTPSEEGMQKECARLYNMMNQELEELSQLAQKANKKRQELAKSRGGSRRKADLGDGSKWGLADVAQFGQLLKESSLDLLELRELRAELKRQVRQIETRMLKVGTRKEEIARFTKAQSDQELAKMLTTRAFDSEHQTQLRRSIKSLRDRIKKLEACLQTVKQKLTVANSGKPYFRAPTLDTIIQTYRKIDLAIHDQTDAIGDISERISKLNLTAPQEALRDSCLPDESRRPFVTGRIAETTAVALNAERAAQKLKRALFSARKEPLLNDKAAQVTPAPLTASSSDSTQFRIGNSHIWTCVPGRDLVDTSYGLDVPQG